MWVCWRILWWIIGLSEFLIETNPFLKSSGKLSLASIMLNLKPNFIKIYSTTPYDFMLEVLFRTSLYFWYIKILLKSFSFWVIENTKPKFQPRYAYEYYAYKKECIKCEKGNWLLQKLIFETFLPNLFLNLLPRKISAKPCFCSQR